MSRRPKKRYIRSMKAGYLHITGSGSRYIVLLGLLLLTSLAATTQSVVSPFPNSAIQVVDRVQLHYRVWPPAGEDCRGNILLMHGFCSSTFSWRHNAEALAGAGYYVVAVDMPPFGYSDRHTGRANYSSNRARWMWQLLDSLAAPCPSYGWHLIGHSMGASTIGKMSLQCPEQTVTLTMVCGSLYATGGFWNLFTRMLAHLPPVREGADRFSNHYFFSESYLRNMLTNAYGREPDSSEVAGYHEPLQISGTARAIVDMVAAKEPDPYSLEDLTHPTLLLWGKADQWVEARDGLRFHKKIPNAEFIWIEEAAHCPMETHPEAFNNMVLEFLDRHSTP